MKTSIRPRIALLFLLAAVIMVPLSCSDLANVEDTPESTPEPESSATGPEITAQNDDSTVTLRSESQPAESNKPLYIIDGVQVSFSDDSGETGKNPLGDINPKDIESIEVLKDAAAMKIYGAAAKHGVVNIRTKGEKTDGPEQED